jgi:hypothetical protein
MRAFGSHPKLTFLKDRQKQKVLVTLSLYIPLLVQATEMVYRQWREGFRLFNDYVLNSKLLPRWD